MEQFPQVGQIERKTQDRIVEFFQKELGYDYLGNWEKRQNNGNIEETLLEEYLQKQNYPDSLIKKAIADLLKTSANQQKSLYDKNKEVYSLLRYGVHIKESPSEPTKTVWLIDWKNPQNNHFAIAEEVTVIGKYNKRPDIVVYVNGIAVGVLELKRSSISIGEGIRQNLDNQKKEFIPHFFTTQQIVMAGNDTQGLKYGTVLTPEKYYTAWREDENGNIGNIEKIGNILDRQLFLILRKERLLELIYNFIIFDKGIKKIARHNQYFAVKATQQSLKQNKGGIIWHTQGSGKSLIMIWLAKWIRENIDDSRVLIVTDRIELDEQIEKVFKGVREEIYKTESGRDLLEKLNTKEKFLICSLIHKFGRAKNNIEQDYEYYIAELRQNLPNDFKVKGNIYVFVDECHRTQSGKLHKAMKIFLPDAVFIGFTGTPLLKKDKVSTLETFGNYIHAYKFDQAVQDGVILDLRYEARDIDQKINSQEKIDAWFEAKTKGLTDVARNQLKKKWGTMQKLLSSRSRLEKIVDDIIFDFETKPRLQDGNGNAMLVADSIYNACKYYELFTGRGFKKCAVITSFNPSINSIKGETTGEDEDSEDTIKYEIYRKMLSEWFNVSEGEAVNKIEEFEREAKKIFIEEPARMKLLIVVDKLLTGFDAPPDTYIYIDKKMQDHGLFQAVCRVNRLDGEDKDYGYIIDYKDLFQKIEKAMEDYTGAAFSGFDGEDVKGLLKDRLKEAKKRLDEMLDTAYALIEGVEPPKSINDYIKYFIGNNPEEKEPLRVIFYQTVASLMRAYANIANEMKEAGYSDADIVKIKKDIEYFISLRDSIKLASRDYIDLKAYEPAMRYLIDSYVNAESSIKLSAFEDHTLLQLFQAKGVNALIKSMPEDLGSNYEAVAETIENNVRRLITDEQPSNPMYYEKISRILDDLTKRRKEQAIDYKNYLEEIGAFIKKFTGYNQEGINYPAILKSKAQKALYDNLGENEDLALKIDKEIRIRKKDSWRGDIIKEREVKNIIKQVLTEEYNNIRDNSGILTIKESKPLYNDAGILNKNIDDSVERLFDIVKKQTDYV